ncbi:MAG: AAA family ATPase [Candidatus Nanoarchaeia archaeon]|nr:AAA family ATPase [Candidatus Nanoarchaeia archaeon]
MSKHKKQTNKLPEENIFLKSLTLTEDFRNLKKGYKIKFDSPITLLVGENGTGKTTVLDLIRSYYDVKTRSYMKSNTGKKIRVYGSKLETEEVFYFDFHSDDMKYSGYFGEDMGSQVSAIWASSGEGAVTQFFSTGITKKESSLILLDELGRGGSIRTHYLYSIFLDKLATKNRNQIIAATHSPIIISELAEHPYCSLYSMEHNRYMKLEDFLKSQKDISKSRFLIKKKN